MELSGIEEIAKEQLIQKQLVEQIEQNLIEKTQGDEIRLTAMKMISEKNLHPAPYGWDATVWEELYNKTMLERLIIAGTLIANEIDKIKASQIII